MIDAPVTGARREGNVPADRWQADVARSAAKAFGRGVFRLSLLKNPVRNSRALDWPGLERGKDTWFRARARNTVGAGPWSDPATIMVT